MTLSWKEVARLKQTERAERISTARKLLEDQGSATTESDDEVYLAASGAYFLFSCYVVVFTKPLF